MCYFSVMITAACITTVLLAIPFEVDTNTSSLSGEFSLTTGMPGTLIGDWHEKTNPEGTTTLPGYWGGSGNNIINCELSPEIGGPYDSPSFGSLDADIDFENSTIELSNSTLSAFKNEPASLALSVGVVYDTFRTTQPSSLYPGDIPFDIPIGNGYLTYLVLEQSIAVSTILEPIGSSEWSFEMMVPCILTFEAEILETPSGQIPTPILVQIQGIIERNGANIIMTIDSMWKSEESIAKPPIAFNDLLVPLPTIIPVGSTANLLFSATAESASYTVVNNIHIVANGMIGVAGDVDGDGYVGVNDLLALIAVWGTCDNCVEDINHDGTVNVTDLLVVIGNWSSS